MSIPVRPLRRNKLASQNGLALVIVIWLLSLLTLMAGSFALSMRRDSSVSLALKTNAEALAQAERGIAQAEFMLNLADSEQRWQSNGTVYEIIGDEVRIRIRIFAESGKVDLNASSETQLEALLKVMLPGDRQRQELLNAILDWRDPDDDTRTLGAENRQYRLAGLAYGPSNAAFQNLEELQLVLGMNQTIYEAIRPYITVYSGAAEVDQQLASPELLAILAGDLADRNMNDAALDKRLETGSGEGNPEGDPGQVFTSKQQTYTIIAEALLQSEAAAGVEVVAQSQGAENQMPFELLDWKQNLQQLSLFEQATELPVITIQDEFRYNDRF